ncbi:MAG: amino acid ABC transporter permease [Rhodocyclaceae bacterium]|nr:amino acid ABC transporter permease [Rhodocyclaceae bacterium]MBK9623771.1 amino acid ABC transporter permease [Rhodocyclaceae bacterium]MBL0075371.1 amino acid ABC transporter permease [Rhodocyclaceae bacterium]MBP6108499.1 amino acid ABC transporter permease [Rhodocyclaceae bacterium]MBP6278320.1 amino acid ABC transporter permease [Rhodocyclaceae bacterium]
MFFGLDFSVLAPSLPFLWTGLQYSVKLTLIAMSGGIVLGTLLALARLSSNRLLSNAAQVYVDTMRSIPLVMVILWFFLLIPLLTGNPVGAESSAMLTFIAFEAAYYSEIMRAGIQSVSRGQVAAGDALGFTYRQTMGYIVLPQAFRNMIPVLLTQTIVLFQDTSLVYIIGAKDLLKAAEIAGKNYNRPIEMYIFVAIIYFVICFTLSQTVKRLQKRVAIIR